jgi:hypothetical protein
MALTSQVQVLHPDSYRRPSVASVRQVDSITGKTGAEPDLAIGTNPSRRTLPYAERHWGMI